MTCGNLCAQSSGEQQRRNRDATDRVGFEVGKGAEEEVRTVEERDAEHPGGAPRPHHARIRTLCKSRSWNHVCQWFRCIMGASYAV